MSCLNSSKPIIGQTSKIERLSAAIEVLLILFCFFLIAWTIPASNLNQNTSVYLRLILLIAIFTLTFVSHLTYDEGLEELGFGQKNFNKAFEILILPTLVISLIMICVSLVLGTFHISYKMLGQLLGIPFWGLLQQYLLQSFINRRLQMVFGAGWLSISLTAMIFSIVHLPNLVLATGTLIAGFIWAYSFQQAPNLYPIALTHGVLSTLFANFVPKWLLPNMVVGYNYLIKIGWISNNY